MPGVLTPALALPYPSIEAVPSTGKTLVIYDGSSSVGSMTTQIATAAGINVIAISGARNLGLSKQCGAADAFDYQDPFLTDKVVAAVRSSDFVGVLDAVSVPETYANSLTILAKFGGGHLACVHPPPENVPENVKAGMIFAVNDIATPVWEDFVTSALESGKLQYLPRPTIVGKGLEFINEGLQRSKEGVSGTKLVVEL